MGRRPEPYLPAVLESLKDAVDLVVVNDNSGKVRSGNRQALERSTLARDGRVAVFEAPFVNFSDARNRCLAHMRGPLRYLLAADFWILMVDCDEVHGAGIEFITRRVLPWVGTSAGVVDSYFVQFMHDPGYFLSMDRRHNLLFRHTPELAWELDVHEHLAGLAKGRLCLPYLYYHMGYVAPTSRIRDKWTQYRSLGDPTYAEGALESMSAQQMFATEVPRSMHYTWRLPKAFDVLGDPRALRDPSADEFCRMVDAWYLHPGRRMRASARRMNFKLRLFWRAVQAGVAGLPFSLWGGLWRLATSATAPCRGRSR